VSASVNLLLHHKVQKLSSGTGHADDRGHKTVVVVADGAGQCTAGLQAQ